MVQMFCKFWGLGMFSIVALTTSNILLTLKLLHISSDISTCDNNELHIDQWEDSIRNQNNTTYMEFLRSAQIVTDHVQPQTQENLGQTSKRFPFDVNPLLGRFDRRRLFVIHDKVYLGPQYTRLVGSSSVSLATQSSADRLFWLSQVSRYWQAAPISIAIFTPDIEYSIVRTYMQYLVTCFPFLGQIISVHFVYPKSLPPKIIHINLDNLVDLCGKPLDVLKRLLQLRPKQMMKWRETLQYPQNLLRNVARKNAATEWLFLTDVDIIPIPNMAADLTAFLTRRDIAKCKKCAFVIPTYEISEKVNFPKNRTQLLNQLKAGNARPFHQKVFIYNQHATNFTRWESREREFPDEKTVSVSHTVTRFEFFYEPFYISRDTVPPHDERFIGYGFTRNTQVYEMYISGYNFSVLTPVFTLHWGMQEKKGRPAWRERQNNLNRKLFEGFKREIYAKYQKDPLGMMKSARSKGKFRKIPGR